MSLQPNDYHKFSLWTWDTISSTIEHPRKEMLLLLLSLPSIPAFQPLTKNKVSEVLNTFWAHQPFFFTPHFPPGRAQLLSTSVFSAIFHWIITLKFTLGQAHKPLWLKKYNSKSKWKENKHLRKNTWTWAAGTCLHMPKQEKGRTDGFLALSSYCFHT